MESDDRTTREERQRWSRPADPAPAPRNEPVPSAQPPLRQEEPIVREPRRRMSASAIRDSIFGRLIQLVNYAFYLLYGLLGLRLVLGLLGARSDAGFVQLVYRLTEPFYRPFAGIVSQPSLDGRMIDLPLVIAFFAYVLVHIAARGLLRLFLSRS